MDDADLQAHERFNVRQKVAVMVNRYVVTVARPDGSEDEVVAFAEQKRMTFREQVTIYTDESGKQVLCTFDARDVVDIGATYDVRDAQGTIIGSFREKAVASLLRSTWILDQPGMTELIGRERNRTVALVRRIWDWVPFVDFLPFAVPYHFDFAEGDKRMMAVDKKFGLRDRYVLDIAAPGLDRRLAIAQAVALDAFQDR